MTSVNGNVNYHKKAPGTTATGIVGVDDFCLMITSCSELFIGLRYV
ncbi:uncharacterized protein METZ01_LOCUS516868 [marine metagenome]|uniref:Uncharacterized protein n=1 Tax=marine metagenome TaxID=408172 RepID=A0A383F554_9ZZZZ